MPRSLSPWRMSVWPNVSMLPPSGELRIDRTLLANVLRGTGESRWFRRRVRPGLVFRILAAVRRLLGGLRFWLIGCRGLERVERDRGRQCDYGRDGEQQRLPFRLHPLEPVSRSAEKALTFPVLAFAWCLVRHDGAPFEWMMGYSPGSLPGRPLPSLGAGTLQPLPGWEPAPIAPTVPTVPTVPTGIGVSIAVAAVAASGRGRSAVRTAVPSPGVPVPLSPRPRAWPSHAPPAWRWPVRGSSSPARPGRPDRSSSLTVTSLPGLGGPFEDRRQIVDGRAGVVVAFRAVPELGGLADRLRERFARVGLLFDGEGPPRRRHQRVRVLIGLARAVLQRSSIPDGQPGGGLVEYPRVV